MLAASLRHLQLALVPRQPPARLPDRNCLRKALRPLSAVDPWAPCRQVGLSCQAQYGSNIQLAAVCPIQRGCIRLTGQTVQQNADAGGGTCITC